MCTLAGTVAGGLLGDSIGLRDTLFAAVILRVGVFVLIRCTDLWCVGRIEVEG
ncbi:hypothetical protein [Alicyclobacillus acidiphilus]|uniref:hypothetical protein n=1 Tax=Alicyclobacillus acidiphilus TaxID=182455 RepID=UPI000A8E6DA8|nr:hypothetical protein [Alicyclobacillus acidiphilus]